MWLLINDIAVCSCNVVIGVTRGNFVSIRRTLFWNDCKICGGFKYINMQFVPHRKHITSQPQKRNKYTHINCLFCEPYEKYKCNFLRGIQRFNIQKQVIDMITTGI
jgi:hypothetical protein